MNHKGETMTMKTASTREQGAVRLGITGVDDNGNGDRDSARIAHNHAQKTEKAAYGKENQQKGPRYISWAVGKVFPPRFIFFVTNKVFAMTTVTGTLPHRCHKPLL